MILLLPVLLLLSGACSLPGEAQAAQDAPPLWKDVNYTHSQVCASLCFAGDALLLVFLVVNREASFCDSFCVQEGVFLSCY